jgi:hypothetical protein
MGEVRLASGRRLRPNGNCGSFHLLGGTALPGSPAEFQNFIADETKKWGKVARAANIKVQ